MSSTSTQTRPGPAAAGTVAVSSVGLTPVMTASAAPMNTRSTPWSNPVPVMSTDVPMRAVSGATPVIVGPV